LASEGGCDARCQGSNSRAENGWFGFDNGGDFQQDAYCDLAQYAESPPAERSNRYLHRVDKKTITIVDGITESQVAESVVDLVAHWMTDTPVDRR